jgi:hypothetical protein
MMSQNMTQPAGRMSAGAFPGWGVDGRTIDIPRQADATLYFDGSPWPEHVLSGIVKFVISSDAVKPLQPESTKGTAAGYDEGG